MCGISRDSMVESREIPWRNTLDEKTRRWNHAMEFHAGFHGQHRAERLVHQPLWNGTELTTTLGADWPEALIIQAD